MGFLVIFNSHFDSASVAFVSRSVVLGFVLFLSPALVLHSLSFLKVLSGCGGCAGGGSDGGGVKAFLTFVVLIGSLLVSLRLLACFGRRQKSLVLIHCFPH